jgi:hypothetical protein
MVFIVLALVRFMVTDRASNGCAYNAVVTRDVARCAATIAPLMQPLASAGLMAAKPIDIATHAPTTSVFILVSVH